jgi:hypothetical protein
MDHDMREKKKIEPDHENGDISPQQETPERNNRPNASRHLSTGSPSIFKPFYQRHKCKWLNYFTLVSLAETSYPILDKSGRNGSERRRLPLGQVRLHNLRCFLEGDRI